MLDEQIPAPSESVFRLFFLYNIYQHIRFGIFNLRSSQGPNGLLEKISILKPPFSIDCFVVTSTWRNRVLHWKIGHSKTSTVLEKVIQSESSSQPAFTAALIVGQWYYHLLIVSFFFLTIVLPLVAALSHKEELVPSILFNKKPKFTSFSVDLVFCHLLPLL